MFSKHSKKKAVRRNARHSMQVTRTHGRLTAMAYADVVMAINTLITVTANESTLGISIAANLSQNDMNSTSVFTEIITRSEGMCKMARLYVDGIDEIERALRDMAGGLTILWMRSWKPAAR